MNNADDSLIESKYALRENDIVEMRMEKVNGKNVGKDVTLVPQDAHVYENQWMLGVIQTFSDIQGDGFIASARIIGDISFLKADAPSSFGEPESVGQHVLFKLLIGSDGNPTAKFVNPMDGMDSTVERERAQDVVESLHQDNFIDDTAKESLTSTRFPADLFQVLPNLDFYRADNPSSFILGALTRSESRGKRDEEEIEEKGGMSGTPRASTVRREERMTTSVTGTVRREEKMITSLTCMGREERTITSVT